MEVEKIEDSFDKSEKYQTVTERYFTPYYSLPIANTEEYHCVLFHSNRICLVTLAPIHPILKEKKHIKNINFQVSKNLDRLQNKVVGKSKKGAQYMQPDSVLCYVECEDGTVYTIYCCVRGKLIEINEELSNNYNLLLHKPLSKGYIAIILPGMNESDSQKSSLLTDSVYKTEIANRSVQNSVA